MLVLGVLSTASSTGTSPSWWGLSPAAGYRQLPSAPGVSGPVRDCAGPLEPWARHFDGVVRTFRHGVVLGVDDAVVDEGLGRRRSVFVDAFAENRVLRGRDILRICFQEHLDGHRWERVMDVCEALREVALAERCRGPAGALALLRE